VLAWDVTLIDDDGHVLVEVGDYMIRRVDPDAVVRGISPPDAPEPPSVTSVGSATPVSSISVEAGTEVDSGRDVTRIRPVDGVEAFRRLWLTPLGPQVVVNPVPVTEVLEQVARVTQETVESDLEVGAGVARPSRSAADGYVAPRDDLERTIARLWADVLGGDEIGVEDDFFELGGNSLVAVQLIALIRKELKVRLPMRSLFNEPTVAGVAGLVSELTEQPGPGAEGEAGDEGEAGEAGQEPTPPPAMTIPRLPRRSARGA
jgi:phthiocerol/phenolphthiocerol synthesis type-I polyketide synthase E